LSFLQSNKNPSHLVSIGCDFHPLVLGDNMNGRGADVMQSQYGVCYDFSESPIVLM
jgi:hypothetical protein